jgi:hypothetical protein
VEIWKRWILVGRLLWMDAVMSILIGDKDMLAYLEDHISRTKVLQGA